MTKLLMVDNYDSFTYNLVQYFGELGAQVEVFRNDEITLEGIAERKPDRLVISPGPCSPAEAGISVAAIRHFAGKLPILGVCLGHQSIGAAFGGNIIRAQVLMHGKTSVITTTQQGVFAGLPAQFTVNRYHSLAIEKSSVMDVHHLFRTCYYLSPSFFLFFGGRGGMAYATTLAPSMRSLINSAATTALGRPMSLCLRRRG
jgi:anthranilate synthase component 2